MTMGALAGIAGIVALTAGKPVLGVEIPGQIAALSSANDGSGLFGRGLWPLDRLQQPVI